MGWLKSFKRTITGEVVQVIEADSDDGLNKMSLRLKREKSTGEHYVILAHTSGETKYSCFDRQEFFKFAAAVEQMAKALKNVA